MLFFLHSPVYSFFFFFNDTATTEIYTLSLHDALPISLLKNWPTVSRKSVTPLRSRPDSRKCLTSILKRLDRKSTRLNSSHQIISYAVFCLKKKKKKITSESERNELNLRQID